MRSLVSYCSGKIFIFSIFSEDATPTNGTIFIDVMCRILHGLLIV